MRERTVQMNSGRAKIIGTVIAALFLGLVAWQVISRLAGEGRGRPGSGAVPVEVAEVEHGPIELQRTFSGSLEAKAKFVVAPKVAGLVERLAVDLSDEVTRGQVVAELDNGEYLQAVNQSEADLAVTRANLAEAKSELENARRELNRVRTLNKRGVASDAQLDSARAEYAARQAQLEVAEAQVTRAEASLETAKIRLGYTEITADWTGGDDKRVVAERYVDQGENVSANTPLLLIVELDPITGVIFVTEKDYGLMAEGQPATLVTDAFPGEEFACTIDRIAPVFRESTRQARVELLALNEDRRLKPGMFIRVSVVLDRVEDATIVPAEALTRRDDSDGVFVLSSDGSSVTWVPVEPGIREGGRLQVIGDGISGKVVTLGQQLVDDGSAVTVSSGVGHALEQTE